MPTDYSTVRSGIYAIRHVAKVAAAHKGKTVSPETRSKMSDAQKARQQRLASSVGQQ